MRAGSAAPSSEVGHTRPVGTSLFGSGCDDGREQMSRAENTALVHRFVAAFNAGAWADLDAVVDADVVTHGAAPVTGLAALKQVFAEFRAAFPDIQKTVQDILAEGDR